MVQAYVLIQTEVAKSGAVAEAVRGIEGVFATDEVTGPYDLIVQIRAETIEELGRMVIARIQEVPSITRTLTCSVVYR